MNWLVHELAAHPHFLPEVIDPLELDLPMRHEKQASPAVAELRQRVARADGFIVVTPEYNHGYPAPLKFLIDSVGAEWEAKPVGFVSYGGVSGGLRAVEQLRQVFVELHTVLVRDSVSFATAWEQFDEQGQLRQPERARRSLEAMLQRLHWWGQALRTARTSRPYRTAA
jgi:NAD(P)H-dependent FMN reductase